MGRSESLPIYRVCAVGRTSNPSLAEGSPQYLLPRRQSHPPFIDKCAEVKRVVFTKGHPEVAELIFKPVYLTTDGRCFLSLPPLSRKFLGTLARDWPGSRGLGKLGGSVNRVGGPLHHKGVRIREKSPITNHYPRLSHSPSFHLLPSFSQSWPC